MKEIPLTQGKVALVDDRDYELVRWIRWHAAYRKGYWAVQTIYRLPSGYRFSMTMAEFLLGRRLGFTPDHANRNTFDNRRRNLRWATRSQQSVNRSLSNMTGYRGLDKVKKRYRARISKDRKMHYLGVFRTPQEAAVAYNKAARLLHGKFARLNPIRPA